MLIKMTRKKVFEFCSNLANQFADIRDTKFAYALQRNIRFMKPLEKELNEILSPSDKIKEYENKRVELCVRFSQKDKELNPIIIQGQYNIEKSVKPAFDKELEKLRFCYQTALAEHKVKQDKIQVLLDEEIELDFLGIKQESLPNNLSIVQLEILEPLIIVEV